MVQWKRILSAQARALSQHREREPGVEKCIAQRCHVDASGGGLLGSPAYLTGEGKITSDDERSFQISVDQTADVCREFVSVLSIDGVRWFSDKKGALRCEWRRQNFLRER